MKHFILFCSIVFLFGCSGDAENAAINFKKAESFMKQKEYEVAEYYFEKIPEESPLYKRSQQKLEEIHALMRGAVLNEQAQAQSVSQSASQEVLITDNSYQYNALGRMPIHSITFANNSEKQLTMLELEFIYYNESDVEITRLSYSVYADVAPGNQHTFNKIMPGIVNEKFARVNIIIKNSLFQ